ncbi:DMT family transporter [Pedobacter gandavensis]|uniref:EamA family transporter n=1 Tax=Pedobacter gandavensis TaxID=2679963 RepID=A0ABR6EVS7_9SPHI|nr:DMT family transporter [Pedobacter gandavensis]MBB2149349.1 EamA family transporter [Pedobacter gandavensis]
MKNNLIKGSIFVGLGSASYGMLATFVKMAYKEGYTTAEVTLSQFTIGVIGLLMISMFSNRQTAASRTEAAAGIKQPSNWKSLLKLMVAGTAMGLTSTFYYLSVQYIPVSVGIVLLMQTVWMGVILEMILHKRRPGNRKIISVLIIIAGTILATNLLKSSVSLDWRGLGWGMLAALSYTITVYASNGIALHLPVVRRSLYLVLGGLIIIMLIFHASLNTNFSYDIFWRWGILLSLFGTILPPLLFTMGMPLTGVGLGTIIAAVEIPVSVLMAHFLLKEPVNVLQWTGIVMILSAVVLMNIEKPKRA